MFKKLYKILIVLGLVYVASIFMLEFYQEQSVLGLNIVFTALMMTVGVGVFIAGAMANDSGRGGFFIHTFQFLAISYPLTYFIGLIGSISVLYTDLESKQSIAVWLASISGIHLLVIVLFFASAMLIDPYK